MKKALYVVPLLLTTLAAWGQIVQMHGTASGSWSQSMVDHIANCSIANYNGCWGIAAGTSGFTQVYNSSTNHATLATDASGCAYLFSDPMTGGDNKWTRQTAWGCGLSYLQYGADGNLYALRDSCGTAGGHYIDQWTGTTWILVAHCFTKFSMDQVSGTGTVEAIDTSGNMHQSLNFGASFSSVSQCNGLGGTQSVAVLNASTFAITCGNNSVWYGSVAGGSYTQLPGSASMVSGAGAALYALGTDKHIYRWVFGTGATSWTPLNGSNVTWIHYSDTADVWTVAGSIYRMTEFGLKISRTYSASTVCTGGPCPTKPEVHHNVNSFFHVNVHGVRVANGSAASGDVNPSQQVTLTPSTIVDDVYGCADDQTECVIATDNEDYTCSQEGTLTSDNSSLTLNGLFVWAVTRVERNPGTQGYKLDNSTYVYHTSPYCSNTDTPMWSPTCTVGYHANDLALQTFGLCLAAVHGICFYQYVGAVGDCTGLGTEDVFWEWVGAVNNDPPPYDKCTP